MATAVGPDRVEVLATGARRLRAPGPKPWTARREKTVTSAEHPGTAVLWDGVHWEVVAIAEGREEWTFDLEPWNERHAIRHSRSYDAAAEAAWAAEVGDARKRRASYGRALALAPLTGLLPAREQERLETEAGVPAARLTILSALPLIAVGGLCLVLLAALAVGGGYGANPVSTRTVPFLFAGLFLLVESLFRLVIAMSQSRPVGSILGVLPWLLVAGRRRESREVRMGHGRVRDVETEEAYELFDAYSLREPWLAFLRPDEQARLRLRFAFDPVRWGRRSAWLVVACAVPIGLTAAVRLAEDPFLLDLGVLVLAGYLVAEQAGRLKEFAAGRAAGSRLFGPAVRAVSRKLLSAV